jgi:hypothetical protein
MASTTPKSGAGGNGSRGSGVISGGGVLPRVIQEVGGGSSYPTLTKTNYFDWVLLMKVKL